MPEMLTTDGHGYTRIGNETTRIAPLDWLNVQILPRGQSPIDHAGATVESVLEMELRGILYDTA
jgi:hypothetical protein